MRDRPETWDIRPLMTDEVDVVGDALGLARLLQGDGFYLVAWANSAPVGHLHLALTDPPELQDVVVLAEHRRHGIARTLVRAAEAEALTRGFHEVRLEVGVGDEVAQSFYRSCGYVDAGLPPRRVHGTVVIRTGPIEVDDTLVTWARRLG